MNLRQIIQTAPVKTNELIAKLSNTSNQAVKTRESLFTELSTELTSYIDLEEQHFLPLLRKHPETKVLAVDALKGNKELRTQLAELAATPKDNDAFRAKLAELSKGFQQHVRDERKELLPAVLKALNDEEAREVAANIEDGVAQAQNAKREEKREQANEAKHEAEEAELVAEAQRAAARTQKAAERDAREASEKVAETVQRGAASAQEGVRQVTANFTEQAQKVSVSAREALTIYTGSVQKTVEDLRAVSAASNAATAALSEMSSAWMEWFGKAVQANVEASQQLMRCRTMKQVAEMQGEFMTSAMRNWMERNTKVLEIVQRTSKHAAMPLDGRLSEAA